MNPLRRPLVQALVIGAAVGLAWAIRGQHGHERGAAFVGACLGLCLAAVTGRERWGWAAVWASLGFAVGGSLSYGGLISQALAGSWHSAVALAGVGVSWGILGGGALAWGWQRSYRRSERWITIVALGVAWWCVDSPLSRTLDTGGVPARMVLIAIMGVTVTLLLSYYVGIRRDPVIARIAGFGAVGFGLGFLIGPAWLVVGPRTGWALDWWKMMEHTIGLFGGTAIGWAALTVGREAPPRLTPWQRWIVAGWCGLGIPGWLWANNLSFWWAERHEISLTTLMIAGAGIVTVVAACAGISYLRLRAGRAFQQAWPSPALRGGFIGFLWLGTLTAVMKTAMIRSWGPTETILTGWAVIVSVLVVWMGEDAP